MTVLEGRKGAEEILAGTDDRLLVVSLSPPIHTPDILSEIGPPWGDTKIDDARLSL